MNFGKVDDPGSIKFYLPEDHTSTKKVLGGKALKKTNIYVGCAKWNRQDLKGFYPRGTKDELTYYATQFNSIELNATFYRIFENSTVEKWHQKSGDDFKFFPKVPQIISQFRRLQNCEAELSAYLDSIAHLKEKLGMIFLQMHPNFAPKSFEVLKRFIENWHKGFPLAVELRHTDWFNTDIQNEVYKLFEKHKVSNIIVDTAGRRDLLHMRLTSKDAFIRYNGANHESDYTRLDDWLERINQWVEQGLKNLYFFVHQNHEQASPLLSKYFIEKLNANLSVNLKIPKLPEKASRFNSGTDGSHYDSAASNGLCLLSRNASYLWFICKRFSYIRLCIIRYFAANVSWSSCSFCIISTFGY